MNPLHLLKMRRWVQRPPSWGRVKLVFAVIAIAVAIWGLEQSGLWPDWAKTDRVTRNPGGLPSVRQ